MPVLPKDRVQMHFAKRDIDKKSLAIVALSCVLGALLCIAAGICWGMRRKRKELIERNSNISDSSPWRPGRAVAPELPYRPHKVLLPSASD